MKLSQQMQQMRGLIGTPEKWTKGAIARDKCGVSVRYSSDSASCFCSYGAVKKVGGNYLTCGYLLSACREFGFSNIAEFNDNNPHWQVMFMWDKAIALCQLDEEMGL